MGMTTDEAINYIIRHCNPDYPNGKTEWETAVNMAIDALKKQIPMKPILCDDEDLTCPTCGADVEWKYYCEECGQKIDHEEEYQWD